MSNGAFGMGLLLISGRPKRVRADRDQWGVCGDMATLLQRQLRIPGAEQMIDDQRDRNAAEKKLWTILEMSTHRC